jgi:predicted acetyltransferase
MDAMSTDSSHATPPWHIRTATLDQMRDFAAPLPAAFAEAFTDAEFADWLKVVEPDRWIAAFERPDGQDALGCAAAYTLRLTVPGGEVGAAAVTAVGVRPDHRRRGILRALMRHQLDDVRERGEPVAVLWASEGAIYQRFGYGLAAMDGSFEVTSTRTAYTRAAPSEGRVRIVTEAESAAIIPPIYDAMRVLTPGALTRTEAWWQSGPLADPEYSRRGASPKFRVVYEADGAAEGYAIYRVKDDWDHRGPKSLLDVKEAVTLTPRALRELWRFLFEVDLVRTVKAARVPVPNPLQQILAEPRVLGLVTGDGLWLRLVDLPAALAGRRYGMADTLVLEIADDFCPWNAGRWQVVTAGEPWAAVASVTRTDTEPDLVLDTADLAAIYLGGIRPSELAEAGRITERTPGALRRANALFTADRTPWCVSMF